MTPFRGTNRVTSPYGMRSNPTGSGTQLHRGQDSVTGPAEDWTVREATGGVVVRVGYDASRGSYIDVRTSPTHFERYQHMQSIYLARGDAAPQGRHLGLAGNTGDSTGRHLHFGVYRCGPETDGYTTLSQINSLEQYSVEPSPWSGIPNAVGSYAGNNDIDGEQAAAEEPGAEAGGTASLLIGPMSTGDRANLTARARELGLPVVVVEEGEADLGTPAGAAAEVKVLAVGGRALAESAEKLAQLLGIPLEQAGAPGPSTAGVG